MKNNCFAPLIYNDLSINELSNLIGGRDIYIWGCGFLGRAIKRYFEKNKLPIKYFCDSNFKLQGNYIDGTKVISPKIALRQAQNKKAFIIICSTRYREVIESHCISSDLKRKKDFLSYIHISRPEAIIEVSGKYNTKFPACLTEFKKSQTPSKYMNLFLYKQVLNKLLKELPSLININLSNWAEPLMNPYLDKIIKTTEPLIPCTVYTTLPTSNKLEEIIKAEPSQFIIMVGGYGKTYEENTAIPWKIFWENIHLLKELINKYKPKTQIAILYHIYKNNQQQDLTNFRNLCLKLDLRFITTWGYLNPYDKLLDLCQKKTSAVKLKILNNLAWNLNNCLKFAKKEANRPCLCQRIFPIINYDLSVSICHIYYFPIIAKNFLELSLVELIKMRNIQSQCLLCQKYGLHRLDIDILIKKYPKEMILINPGVNIC